MADVTVKNYPPEPGPGPGPGPNPPSPRKTYVWCRQKKCESVQLTDEEAKNYAGSIARCSGKNIGDPCGYKTPPCSTDADCPTGQKCVNGKCEGVPEKTVACVGGVCKEVDSSTPELIAACNGKKVGESCGQSEGCKSDADCPAGWVCQDGKCKEYKKTDFECASDDDCIKKYGEGYKCVDGYCRKGKTKKKDCKSDADCPEGYECVGGYCEPERHEKCTSDADCPEGKVCKDGACYKKGNGNGNGNGGGGGEFKWSDVLKNLLDRLGIRAGDLLGYKSPDVLGKLGPVLDPLMKRMQYLYDYPRGLTPEERQGVINYAVKGIKRGERGRLQSMRDRIARMGLLGSGFELSEAGRIGRETREAEADIRQRLAIDELDRRFKELMGTTGMAAQLAQVPIGLEKWNAERVFREMMGTTGLGADLTKMLMGAEQIPETLSAARRAEGQGSMEMLLRLLATMMGGQQSFLGPYMQAIMTQGQSSQGPGIGSWLPYIMASQLGRG